MADTAHQKRTKSVAFSEGTTIVDANGEVSEGNHTEDKVTAESHAAPADKEVDAVTDMFAGLNKKKKKSSSKKTATSLDEEIAPDAEPADGAVAETGAFDASALKKKKKKPKPKADAGDFDAKLAEAGVGEGEDGQTETTGNEERSPDAYGDWDKGTGIWQHDSTTPIPYRLLTARLYAQLNQQNPDVLSSGSKSYKIPPPQCLREGNKKTIFANIADICKRMKRLDEHVTQFLFAELGTSGSVDGNQRLVIKGRFQQKQIENVLRRYIVEYVTCKTCRSGDTELIRGENRLFFLTCKTCGSRRSVVAIKSGFTAQVGKRKRLG